MIIVAAYVTVKNGMEKEFMQVAQDCIAKTRHETGCISYNLLRSSENPHQFTFFEEWQSQPHLDSHMKTAHFKAFAKGSEAMLAEPIAIKLFSAEPVKA